MNNVNLIGRLIADPELKSTQSGIPVCSFTVAVDRQAKEKQTDFINVVTWRNTAEFVSKYFNKGKPIALTGFIQTRKYEDKDGNKRTAVEVVAQQVYFVPQDKTQASAESTPTGFTEVGSFSAEDEDLPF